MSAKHVTSKDNPLYRSLARLASSARERRGSARALLEGEHLIMAYRDAGLGEAELVVASESALARPAAARLFETLPAASRVVLSDRLVSSLSQAVSAEGLLAVVRTPQAAAEPAAVGDAVLLERVQDPGNLGSILRTALAAGVRDIFLSPGSAQAWSPKVVRAGMGAHFGLRLRENAELSAVAALAAGVACATEPAASRSLYEVDLRGPVAWIFGNEGSGLSGAASAAAAVRVRIPMPGGTESLNVAAAVAVCLFEQVRQRAGGNG